MAGTGSYMRPDAVARAVFAAATLVFGALGVLVDDGRLLVAAGLCGILWTLWDVLWGRLLGPAGQWFFRMLTEGSDIGAPPNVRPTLDDTIRLLESHLQGSASRSVQIQAAIRLEEIYRTIRRDPERAQAVIRQALERYPDAPELRQAGWRD